MTVTQDEDGTCRVTEHDLKHEANREVATFPADMRVITVRGDFGPEIGNRDCAQIRANTFAMIWEKLVNEGNIELD